MELETREEDLILKEKDLKELDEVLSGRSNL